MTIHPTPFDLWLATKLAVVVAAHPQFTLAVESGIRHTVFGGLWFGAALFALWIQAARTGHHESRLRVLSILVGMLLAIMMTMAAGALISWPPPFRIPTLENLYQTALLTNPNTNCFPSQSTAAYCVVAAGVYSLHKAWGWLLWALVLVIIALPRMFVGGHYFTDVVVGAVLALIGYAAARNLLERKLISPAEDWISKGRLTGVLLDLLVFVWIFQVTVEFREVTWAKAVLEFFWR
jgi:membrane-associated phospholipid phosphatase